MIELDRSWVWDNVASENILSTAFLMHCCWVGFVRPFVPLACVEFTKERLLVISFNIEHLECSKDTDGNEIKNGLHWYKTSDLCTLDAILWWKTKLARKTYVGGFSDYKCTPYIFLKRKWKIVQISKVSYLKWRWIQSQLFLLSDVQESRL